MPSTSESNIEKKVEIITDDLDRKTTPSVVTEDSEGNIIVGHVAKQRAGLKPKPIFFIKRSMGTANTQKLLGKDCTPVDISSEILKYLKEMAEQKLKAPVTKAVICVPAYFGLLLQNDTQKAAELAGLEIPEGGILLEPIAAAMAYGLEDKRKDLNIFCFDFGGGTFDATILCKENGQFIEEDLAFGGDPYLGGYDFDKLLANYILNKLRKKGKGYKLNLDFNNEEDDARYQILLMIAEKYKHLLSDYPEVSVREESTRTFNDQAGNPVNIDMTLTIQEFNALIMGESDKDIEEEIQKDLNDQELENIEKKIQNRPASVRKTMYLSQIVLKKAKLFPEEIDQVIMVGGSSYIPLVQQELENLFGRKPKLVDPDSTIAKGAALRAATFISKGIPGLQFTRLPEKTSLAKVNIIGQLDTDIIGVELSKVKLQLSRTDGAYEAKISPDSKGNFIFNNVELIEEDNVESDFILTITDDSNKELLSYNFSIAYGPESIGNNGLEPLVITQSIRIDTVDGKKTLFPAGKRLPFTEDVHGLETSDQSGILRIPFFEGHQFIGEIKVEGLNTSLPVGTPIELRVNIYKDQTLTGWANVPADNKKEGNVITTLFIPPIPSIEKMDNNFEDLKDSFDESIRQVPDINIKLKYKDTGEAHIENIKNEFDNKPAVKEKIYGMLQELEDMIKDIKDEVILKPSLEEFNIKVEKAYKKDSENKFAKEIPAIQEQGNKAFIKKNKILWQEVNENLDKILAQLGDEGGGGFWEMWNNLSKEQKTMFFEIEMKKWLIEDIRELSKEAQGRGIANKYGDKLRDVERQLNELDSRSDPDKALEKWFDLRGEIDKLRYDITGETPTEEDDEGKPRKRT
jgi:hypothetical protein